MESELILYTTEDGVTKVDVTFVDETVWLTQEQMADLFQKSKSTINEHIKNIYSDGELNENDTMRKFGNSEFSTKPTNYYNLDMIISVGYRVRSQRGVQFRIWASRILKEYMRKGFAMDDQRLKELGGGGYFKELLERIRDIRASEKVFYRQILEKFMPPVLITTLQQRNLSDSLKRYRIKFTMLYQVKLQQRSFIIELMLKKSLWD